MIEDTKIKAEVVERPQKPEHSPETVTHAISSLWDTTSPSSKYNPWRDADFKKVKSSEIEKKFKEVVQTCRYFYRKDPIANTTIDKLVEIGVNNLVIDKGTLSDNQYRVLEGVKEDVLDFLKEGALEFLVSGLVVPEVNFKWMKKEKLEEMGVKKYKKLWLPSEMWFRDPELLELKKSLFSREPLYYLLIPREYLNLLKERVTDEPPDVIDQIANTLQTSYPGFVEKLKAGHNKILLEDKHGLFIRRKPMVDMPYPTPYLYAAIEPLQHKRNIRAMDYALASRVIEAIQVFRLGDKDFPLTQETEYQLEELKDQIRTRYALTPASIERVFQLFANHTLEIEWIIPPIEALLDSEKYSEVNQDIIYALGFPRLLIMGESERTGSSDHDFATLSPVATMENFRGKLLKIAKYIFDEIVRKNDLGDYGGVRFEEVNLVRFADFSESLLSLYEKGNVSRESVSEFYGYNWKEEVNKRKEERDLLEELGLDEYNPQPFDKNTGLENQPNTPNTAKKE